jgi:hypothetical protein
MNAGIVGVSSAPQMGAEVHSTETSTEVFADALLNCGRTIVKGRNTRERALPKEHFSYSAATRQPLGRFTVWSVQNEPKSTHLGVFPFPIEQNGRLLFKDE